MDEKISFFKTNEEGEDYAIAIAISLGLSIGDGKKAAQYWPCKSCILAYLYALYLKLLDKYLALLAKLEENILENIKLLNSIWKSLEQDKIASQKEKAEDYWIIIQTALKEIEDQNKIRFFDSVKTLNNNSSGYTLKRK